MTWHAIETGVTTATFKTKAASVGIPLALLLNDRALLDACANDATLDLARKSGEMQRIASVSAAFAQLRVAQGSRDEARAILRRAVRSIAHAHRAWDLFIAIARFGDPSDAVFARALLEGAVGRPVVKRAYRLLFDAFLAEEGMPHRTRLARLAAREFERMGNVLYAAHCAEAAGEAGQSWRTLQSIGAVQPVPEHGGTPALTPRQQQIAELVARGETNRSIARLLNVSEHTVEHHVSAIFERLGLHSRAQLAHMLGQRDLK
jgi:DNA-binding CsgD family transcriptional regulator